MIEVIRLGQKSDSVKDLEILLLRLQLAIYEQRQGGFASDEREKLAIVVLAIKLKAETSRTIKAMGEVIRIVKSAAVFGWYRKTVRRSGRIVNEGQVIQE